MTENAGAFAPPMPPAVGPVLAATPETPQVGPNLTAPSVHLPPVPNNWQDMGQPVLAYDANGVPYIDFVKHDASGVKYADEYDKTDDADVPMISHIDRNGIHHRVKVAEWSKYEVQKFGPRGKYQF